MSLLAHAHPILSCEKARALEAQVLQNEDAEWSAMKRAGFHVARGIVQDFQELSPVPQHMSVLALIGKGNNGGDALIACGQMLADFPRASGTLLLLEAVDQMRPLAKRALQQLEGRVTVRVVAADETVESIQAFLEECSAGAGFDVCIDGLLGMAFNAPLRESVRTVIQAVNEYEKIRMRAAVDLPSGRGDESDALSFHADFSYATGIAKKVLFEGLAECGRVRYIDLGFFDRAEDHVEDATDFVLKPSLLDALQKFRSPSVDKRSFGHVFIVGGSSFMPGALLMAVQSAVRSGVGLVTAFAPVSVAATLSAQVPEAMWVPWPESSAGTLSPRALRLLMDRIDQATAVLVGPGMGKERNSEQIAREIVNLVEQPVVLDADALRARAVELAQKRKSHMGPVLVTPHMGEYMRIAKLAAADTSSRTLKDFCRQFNVFAALKGPITRLCDGDKVYMNTVGGPVLSRGGSGDILAGLIGGMIAQDQSAPLTAIARAVTLQGLAAERFARRCGQVAVHTTQMLDDLPEVLRGV